MHDEHAPGVLGTDDVLAIWNGIDPTATDDEIEADLRRLAVVIGITPSEES